jgi:hypothetical protein
MVAFASLLDWALWPKSGWADGRKPTGLFRPKVDNNLRRRGKRFLATLFFIDQWRFHMRPRAIIERHFAWAKRYFGLEAARWRGLVAAYQHTALVYSVMLGVALIAHRLQRPDLAGSRTKVLAVKTLA